MSWSAVVLLLVGFSLQGGRGKKQTLAGEDQAAGAGGDMSRQTGLQLGRRRHRRGRRRSGRRKKRRGSSRNRHRRGRHGKSRSAGPHVGGTTPQGLPREAGRTRRHVKIAVLLDRPVGDFLAVARNLAGAELRPGCLVSSRLFRWDRDGDSLVSAVTSWAPDGILAMGALPASLLAHWVGVPKLGIAVPSTAKSQSRHDPVLPVPLGPSREGVRSIVVSGAAVSSRRIVYLDKKTSVGRLASGGQQGIGQGKNAPVEHSSGARRDPLELHVRAERPEQLVARLLEFSFRPGDLVVMGPSPDLFPEVVVRLLVSLQFSRGILVVGFSRRHVLYGTVLGIGAVPAALSGAVRRTLAPLCLTSSGGEPVHVFGPKRTWWYNPKVLSQLRDNNVILRKAAGWIPVAGDFAGNGTTHNIVRR